MHTHFCKTLSFVAVICFTAASGLFAQTAVEPKAQSAAPSQLEVAFTYSAARSDVVGGANFWMQGGGIQARGLIYRGLGIVADLSGLHENSIQSSGGGIDIVTATFGPRYTWQLAHTRYSFYGQALAGIANGFNSDFPSTSGAVSRSQSLAVKLGGGFNIFLTPRIGLRAIEANWLRTQFPNSSTGTQSSCQLNSGLVLRF